MRQLLKLQHHKHTGKLLAHHHTSYRGLLLLLSIVGVLLVIIQHAAQAADLLVTAKVPAAPLTIPAVISSPQNGTVYTVPTTTVEGTCEYAAPASVVAIYIGTRLAGSTPCDVAGSFSISVTLDIGTNVLVARTVNITDDYGPDSQPVTVTYTPPVVPPASTKSPTPDSSRPSSSPSNPKATSSPVEIRAVQTYIVFGPHKAAVWQGYFSGGTTPYTVMLDWGDGTTQTFRGVSTEQQAYRHTYKVMQPYFITVNVTDTVGSQAQFMTTAVTPYPASIFGTVASTTTPFLKTPQGIFVLTYTAYVFALALAALAWYDARVRRLRFATLYLFPKHPPATKVRARTNRRRSSR